MEIEVLAICKSVQDIEGKTTFDRVFNTMDVFSFPFSDPFYFAARVRYYEKEFGKHTFHVFLTSPEGKKSTLLFHTKRIEPPQQLGFPVGFTLDTLILDMGKTIFPIPGVYTVTLEIDKIQIAAVPIIIPLPITNPN